MYTEVFYFSFGRAADGFHLSSMLRRRLPSIDNYPQLHVLTSAGERGGQRGDGGVPAWSGTRENRLYFCVDNF